jgi:hypothetical protein
MTHETTASFRSAPEGREAALGEIAAAQARLLHQRRTEGFASRRLQKEPTPV